MYGVSIRIEALGVDEVRTQDRLGLQLTKGLPVIVNSIITSNYYWGGDT